MGGGAPASGNVCDGGGCEVATSQPTTVIRGSGAPSGPTIYQSTYTGNTCAAGPTAGETAAQCLSGAAGTTCAVAAANAGGKNCGTFNGDEVCVQSIPPGTCQSYASGGVACTAASGTMVPSPPGPNNGTAGTAATPTGSVTNNTNTTNYYSSSVVNNSSSVVATNPGGSNAGNGATGATGSTGSGNGPSAGNGDCGASGVDCGSDGSTPTLPDEPTVLETAQSYYGALGAVPIVAAVSGIGASIPAGSCPTATYSVFGREFTMDAQCALWDSIAPILELIMLAVYTLIGVRILMSA